MQEEDLAKKQEEELQYLKERINTIPKKDTDAVNKISESEARAIAESVREKIEILKICYGKSDAKVRESIHQLIRFPQLRCFLANEMFTDNSKKKSRKIILTNIIYSPKMIHIHINAGLPDERRVLEFYSFYYGRYRLFFRCFERDFLKQEKLDEEFLDDIFSPKEGDYYVSGERLEIAGVTIIDEEFVKNIKKLKYSVLEFYTAKKYGDTQWCGIVNGFDVERKEYGKLRDAVINSLNQNRDYKISSIVHGTGGAGKSTVLRRLCIDIQNITNHVVVWVDHVIKFYKEGIPIIKHDLETNSEKKYLIVIEDWSRMFHNNAETGIKILEELHECNSIRIVIGDRTTVGKPYEDYGSNYNLLLSSNENREIIEQIIKKFPDWQEASETLFESLNNDQPTLFLLLFILSRISQDKIDTSSIDLSDSQVVFRNVIKSDLEFIENEHIGLAKALYYWGCIYAEYRVSITYEAFLQIANFYNGKDNNENVPFDLWDAEDTTIERLKVYINIDGSNGVQFNHDLLADLGLSEIQIDKWKLYGTKIKSDLLNIIIDNEIDHYASQFLGLFLRTEERVFKNTEEKLSFIKKLIYKSNKDYRYLEEFAKLALDTETLKEFAQLLWDKQIYNTSFWYKYFHIVQDDVIIDRNIHEILNVANLDKYDEYFIVAVLNNKEDLEISKTFMLAVLNNYTNINPSIVKSCIENLSDSEKIKISKKILFDVDWKNTDYLVILACLKSTAKKVKSDFASKVLQDQDWKSRNNYLIEKCLHYATKKIKSDFASKVLQDDNYKDFPSELQLKCFELADNTIKKHFVLKVLSDSEWQDNDCDVFRNCLDFASDEVKENFANKILTDENWLDIDFYIYKNKEYFTDEVKSLYSRWGSSTDDILLVCLNYASEDVKKNFSEKVIQDENLHHIDSDVVQGCLCFVKKEVRVTFFAKILTDENWKNYDRNIVLACLFFNRPNDNNYNKVFITSILDHKDLMIIDIDIIDACLRYAEKNVTYNFCERNLSDAHWRSNKIELIRLCLGYAEENIRHNFCERNLNDVHRRDNKIEIIRMCLGYAKENVRNEFCIEILNDSNWNDIKFDIFEICIKHCPVEILQRNEDIHRNIIGLLSHINSYEILLSWDESTINKILENIPR